MLRPQSKTHQSHKSSYLKDLHITLSPQCRYLQNRASSQSCETQSWTGAHRDRAIDSCKGSEQRGRTTPWGPSQEEHLEEHNPPQASDSEAPPEPCSTADLQAWALAAIVCSCPLHATVSAHTVSVSHWAHLVDLTTPRLSSLASSSSTQMGSHPESHNTQTLQPGLCLQCPDTSTLPSAS